MRHKAQPQLEGDGVGGRFHALAALADRQHGVVSVTQLIELGHSRDRIKRAAASGRLHPIDRGVYAVGHTRLSPHGRCFAAVFAGGPGAVLSHHSAAWLHALARWSPEPFHVTGPVARRPRLPVRIHRARRLEEADRLVVEGIPVTAVPRTLLDLAAAVKLDRLERMVERAEERELFDLRALEELLARTVGHHGHGRLRRAIALYRPTSFTRSGLEKRFLELVLEAGLPQPRANHAEMGYELDCYWPEFGLAVELDVFETHGSRAAFERDRKRQEDLLLGGIAMTRVTGPRLEREPEQVTRRVARLLEQRGWRSA